MKLSEKMVEYRARHDMTQKKLAEKCSLSVNTVARAERGGPLNRLTIKKIEMEIEEGIDNPKKNQKEDFSVTPEIREMVHEIVDRFLDYNPSATEVDKTGDKPTFYINLSGHICAIDVRCNTKGYKYQDRVSESVYLTPLPGVALNNERTLNQLRNVLVRMDEIYNNWEEKIRQS